TIHSMTTSAFSCARPTCTSRWVRASVKLSPSRSTAGSKRTRETWMVTFFSTRRRVNRSAAAAFDTIRRRATMLPSIGSPSRTYLSPGALSRSSRLSAQGRAGLPDGLRGAPDGYGAYAPDRRLSMSEVTKHLHYANAEAFQGAMQRRGVHAIARRRAND